MEYGPFCLVNINAATAIHTINKYIKEMLDLEENLAYTSSWNLPRVMLAYCPNNSFVCLFTTTPLSKIV